MKEFLIQEYYHYIMKNKIIRETFIEKCVNCGKETPYTIDNHIDYRNYYIEGVGQLCKDCYNEIYNK